MIVRRVSYNRGSRPLPQAERAAVGLDESRGLALALDLAMHRGVHGVDNVGESGRLSGRQQKGEG